MKKIFCKFKMFKFRTRFVDNYNSCALFFRPVKVDGINDIAVIMGSSGTTGMSKRKYY